MYNKNYYVDFFSHEGQIQLWIDGNSVINVDGLSLRETESGKIKGMHFQTFFGGMFLVIQTFNAYLFFTTGHGDDWASPKDQRGWFADVTGTVIC